MTSNYNTLAPVGPSLTTATSVAGTGSVNAQQTVTFTGVTSGTFSLNFNGQTTAPITYSATAATLAANIQAGLMNLPNVGGLATAGTVSVSVTGSVATVTFGGSLGLTALPTMTANNINLNAINPFGGAVTTTAGVAATNAVQTLTFAGPINGGTFLLTFNGQTTATPINWSSTPATLAANIQAGLLTLSSVPAGTVSVTATSATTYQVAFSGTLGNSAQPLITTTPGGLTGNNGAITVSGAGTVGSPYVVSFGGPLANFDQPLLGTANLVTVGGITPAIVTGQVGAERHGQRQRRD